jgi:hypothetical protein
LYPHLYGGILLPLLKIKTEVKMRYIVFSILALMLSVSLNSGKADNSVINQCVAGRFVPEIINIEYVPIDGYWYEIIYYDNGDIIMHSTGRPVDGDLQDGKDAVSLESESLMT